MITWRLSLFSLSDMLIGIKISSGHREYMNDTSLVEFSRLEVGLVFIHLEITKYHKE